MIEQLYHKRSLYATDFRKFSLFSRNNYGRKALSVDSMQFICTAVLVEVHAFPPKATASFQQRFAESIGNPGRRQSTAQPVIHTDNKAHQKRCHTRHAAGYSPPESRDGGAKEPLNKSLYPIPARCISRYLCLVKVISVQKRYVYLLAPAASRR